MQYNIPKTFKKFSPERKVPFSRVCVPVDVVPLIKESFPVVKLNHEYSTTKKNEINDMVDFNVLHISMTSYITKNVKFTQEDIEKYLNDNPGLVNNYISLYKKTNSFCHFSLIDEYFNYTFYIPTSVKTPYKIDLVKKYNVSRFMDFIETKPFLEKAELIAEEKLRLNNVLKPSKQLESRMLMRAIDGTIDLEYIPEKIPEEDRTEVHYYHKANPLFLHPKIYPPKVYFDSFYLFNTDVPLLLNFKKWYINYVIFEKMGIENKKDVLMELYTPFMNKMSFDEFEKQMIEKHQEKLQYIKDLHLKEYYNIVLEQTVDYWENYKHFLNISVNVNPESLEKEDFQKHVENVKTLNNIDIYSLRPTFDDLCSFSKKIYEMLITKEVGSYEKTLEMLNMMLKEKFPIH